MPKALAIQINWQFTGGAGIMQVEHTADCFGGACFKSPLSTEYEGVWKNHNLRLTSQMLLDRAIITMEGE